MTIKNWKKEIYTIPNILSLFRLLLIPVYITVYLNAKTSSDYFIAAAILAVSCLTDLIDGQIARRFNMISTLGKILDPLADKLTQFVLIVCLALKRPILWYLVSLFVIKEGFQLVAGTINFKRGRMLKGALFSGKICTAVLFISLIILVMIPQLHANIVNTTVVVDICFMLISLTNYVLTYIRQNNKFQPIEIDSESHN